MKQKNHIELLINIVSEMIEASKTHRLTTKELKSILFEAEYPPQETIKLIEWFQRFAQPKEKQQTKSTRKTKSLRLFSKEEIQKISYKNLNKLNEMLIANILSSHELELIIKQAMEIKSEQITDHHFKWICKMVVANQQDNPNNKDIIAYMLNRDSEKIITH